MTASPRTIILWCHPRSTSTMFERAFLTRPEEFSVLHEPLGDPWYFGPEHVSKRYSPNDCAEHQTQLKESTFAETWKDIAGNQSSNTNMKIFSKDMAYYIFTPPNPSSTAHKKPEEAQGNPTLIPEKDLLAPHIIHTFLIRTPEKAVPSFYKLCSGEQSKVTGFQYFDKHEVGLQELRQLYEFIEKKTGTSPLVVDSEDLLLNPEGMMKRYCEHVGVDFQSSMLQWDSGQQDHFKKWAGWHTDAEKSTGIKQKPPTTADSQKEWPDEVNLAIKENMNDYNWLRDRRTV